MKKSVAYGMLLLAYVSAPLPAIAQIQPGPNIAPNGTRFTYSPRFGYIGPPRAFVPYPPPAPTPYGRPGSMPTTLYPREPLSAPMAYAPAALPLPPPVTPEPPPAPCIVAFDPWLPPLLNVRASPNGWIVAQLPNGTPVFPTGEFAGNWVVIAAPIPGWVFAPYLACLPPPPPDTASLGAPPVRLNERPGIPPQPEVQTRQAPRPPVGRKAPNVPCPAGCPREPDEVPIK